MVYVGWLEPGTASLKSWKKGELKKVRYFQHDSGRVDLKKYPGLMIYHVKGQRDVLVEPWTRKENLYLEEGKSKLAIFETIYNESGMPIIIPCLRKLENIITLENDNVLEGYKETLLGVSWNDGADYITVESNKLIGVVKYESV